MASVRRLNTLFPLSCSPSPQECDPCPTVEVKVFSDELNGAEGSSAVLYNSQDGAWGLFVRNTANVLCTTGRAVCPGNEPNGRAYTVWVKATDAAGNSRTLEKTVLVPLPVVVGGEEFATFNTTDRNRHGRRTQALGIQTAEALDLSMPTDDDDSLEDGDNDSTATKLDDLAFNLPRPLKKKPGVSGSSVGSGKGVKYVAKNDGKFFELATDIKEVCENPSVPIPYSNNW
jgi:hypothetical protein